MINNDYRNGYTRRYNTSTGETTHCDTPIFWKDEFVGSSYASTFWTVVDQSTLGSPTVARRADSSSGEIAFTVANTNESEDIGISWGNERNIDLTKKPFIEFRISPATAIGSNDCFAAGVCSDHNNTSAGAFGFEGSTIRALIVLNSGSYLNYCSDDASTDTGVVATTITKTTSSYYICSIDFYDLEAVKFRINGITVGTTNMSNMRSSNTLVQPYFVVSKKSGLTTPSCYLDYCLLCSER